MADYFRRIEWARANGASTLGDSGFACDWRDITRQAYALNSPWNTPIGKGAQYGLSTDADVLALQALGSASYTNGSSTKSHVHSGDNNAQLWVVSTASDPLIPVTDISNSSSPDWAGSSTPVHIPLGTRPYGGTEHLSVIDTAQSIVWHGYLCQVSDASGSNYQYYNPVVSNSKIQFKGGRFNDLYGNAVSPCTAPGIPSTELNRLGWGDCALRVEDVLDFYGPNNQRMDSIRHVLRFALSVAEMNGYLDTAPNTPGFHWPNVAVDYCYNKAGSGTAGVTAAYVGSQYTSACGATGNSLYSAGGQLGISTGGIDPCLLFAIPTIEQNGPDIRTIRTPDNNLLTPEAMAVAWTLQNFGMMWRDSTGGDQIALKCDPRLTSAAATGGWPYRPAYSAATQQFYNAIVYAFPTLMTYMSIVRNYSNGSDGLFPYAGGGGLYTRPAAPYGPGDCL
jgi:hypothetical protein